MRSRRPKGVLLDYGGTLVEEVAFDPRAGNEWLLTRAAYRPAHITLERVLERAAMVSKELAARRDEFHLETPWPMLTRLVHDFFGIQFEEPLADLELGFWKASVKTLPMPGAVEALEELYRCEVPIGVVSNCAFGPHVIRYELAKHGLAERLRFVMVSADYAVRKPNALLFETAAAKIGIESKDIWFVGDRLDTDVTGAKAAGMTAVWFQRSNDALSDEADLTVAGWSDFVCRFREAELK